MGDIGGCADLNSVVEVRGGIARTGLASAYLLTESFRVVCGRQQDCVQCVWPHADGCHRIRRGNTDRCRKVGRERWTRLSEVLGLD